MRSLPMLFNEEQLRLPVLSSERAPHMNKLAMSDGNTNLVLGLRCGLTPTQTGRLTVGRNVNFILQGGLDTAARRAGVRCETVAG
jgi:hypothetical protein